MVTNWMRLLCFLFVTLVVSINRSGHRLNLNEALPFRPVYIMVDDPSLESTEGAFGRIPDDIEVPRHPRRLIQGSVAGASIASHGSVTGFGHATRRTLDKIIQDKVIVQTGDRGAPGLKIFVTNWSAATQALPIKFLGSFHLQSKNAAGKNNQKAKYIQEEFDCTIFLRNTSLGDFYYSGVYTCFGPPSMRHFQIAVPTRHYFCCYVHIVEIHHI